MRFIYFLLLVFPALGQKNRLLPDTISLCEGDSALIELRQELGEQSQIRWVTPAGSIQNTRKIRVSAQGRHRIFVRSSAGILLQSDSTFVKVLARPRHVLRDSLICAGKEITLDARNAGMRYLWNTGEKSRQITVRKEGTYWVRISNGKCLVHDTVQVSVAGITNPLGAGETQFCLNENPRVLAVKPARDVTVRWSTGSTSYSIHAAREGKYVVSVFHPRCGEVRDSIRVKFRACECEVLVPNRFTPNEDGRNDLFFPVLACDYTYYKLTISDRWGNVVFESLNPQSKWDGRYKGNLCPEDIYVYRLETTEKVSEKKEAKEGTVALIR